jgi:hypothetical protein
MPISAQSPRAMRRTPTSRCSRAIASSRRSLLAGMQAWVGDIAAIRRRRRRDRSSRLRPGSASAARSPARPPASRAKARSAAW